MIRFPFFLRLLLMMVVAAQLVACSKTVKWEEEVLLNTGQTVIVKQSVVYEIGGDAGNPFDLGFRPSGKRKLEFVWDKKNYVFDLKAGVMVLAISPNNQPILVAPADAGAWYATNSYQCTLPFYVQFSYDDASKRWVWPKSVDLWVYELPANLLRDFKSPDEMKKRYTSADIADQGYMHDPSLTSVHKIDKKYTGDLCKSKFSQQEK